MKIRIVSVILGLAAVIVTSTNTFAATRAQILADELANYTSIARRSYDPGSPVKPSQKVVICHKGQTKKVVAAAVPGHLAHGDTLGPCPTNTF